MPLYRYIKAKATPPQLPAKRSGRTRFPLTSMLLMTSGLLMIGWVLWPIAAFELIVSPSYIQTIRPIPDPVIVQAMDNSTDILGDSSNNDYTKASTWFPKSPQKKERENDLGRYTISIPKIRIHNSHAIVGGDDLDSSLIHYGGTPLPGQYGNAVVFGHSVLPVFFNPQNYLTIFSLLPTLTEGDEIFVTLDNVTYKYTVSEMKVVSPDNISVLEQQYDWSYLSLVTCVPPGTYWKRLIVRSKLEKI